MTNIKVVTLLNGENIIGHMKYVPDNNRYQVEKPQVVLLRPQNNQMSINLMPWPLLANHLEIKKSGIWINADLVIADYLPNEQLLSLYTQVTSGLITPNKPVLLTE